MRPLPSDGDHAAGDKNEPRHGRTGLSGCGAERASGRIGYYFRRSGARPRRTVGPRARPGRRMPAGRSPAAPGWRRTAVGARAVRRGPRARPARGRRRARRRWRAAAGSDRSRAAALAGGEAGEQDRQGDEDGREDRGAAGQEIGGAARAHHPGRAAAAGEPAAFRALHQDEGDQRRPRRASGR